MEHTHIQCIFEYVYAPTNEQSTEHEDVIIKTKSYVQYLAVQNSLQAVQSPTIYATLMLTINLSSGEIRKKTFLTNKSVSAIMLRESLPTSVSVM